MSICLIVFMFALWSTVFSLGKMALESSPPIFLTGFRMIFAGLIIICYLLFRNRSLLKLTGKQYLHLFWVAIFSIYLANVLELWGLQYLSVAKTCFIYSLSPFFAILLSYLHFKEKMNTHKWIGLGLGFIGFIPVLLKQTGTEDLLNAVSFISWPAFAIMGAAFCSVYGYILFRLMIKESDISPVVVNGVTMLIGGMIALLHSFLVENWDPLPVSNVNLIPFLKGILIIVFISNIVCHNLYGMMLKRFTSTFLSFFGLLSPFFASFSAWFLLNEASSLSIFLSSSIVCLGLWIVYHAELKQGYILPNQVTLS